MERSIIANKKECVKVLAEKLEKAVSFYIVDFTGLNANGMNNLRRKFKNNKFEYFVIKNSILERAGDNLGLEEIKTVLTGPNAISISYEDPIGPAKIISDFYKENKLLTVKLCYIEGKWYSSDEVKKLAGLPSKEVLLGQLFNLINNPVNKFVSLLGNILGNFVRVLDAIKGVKEEEVKDQPRETKNVKKEEVEVKKGQGEKQEKKVDKFEEEKHVDKVIETNEEKQSDEKKESEEKKEIEDVKKKKGTEEVKKIKEEKK
ncbi:50S ribosomal protein L10 [candidate division WOR-3 bacterium]|nr:50S ribosomal protein L10 [candidate division WOR-3 bacterium]